MKQSQMRQCKEKEANKMFIVISNKEYAIEINEETASAFMNIKETLSKTRNRIALPKDINSIEYFRKYLSIVLSIKKKGKDWFGSELFEVFELLKLIDISIALNDEEITTTLIEDKLKHQLSKENCLMILAKYTLIQSKSHLISIQSLINDCINLAAKKLNELMILSNRSNINGDERNEKDELMSLPEYTFINIISQYFKEHTHQGYDHTNIIQLLMKMRRIENNDIFTLIEGEKTYSIGTFEKAINDNNLLLYTHLEWTINHCCFKGDVYKESDIYYYGPLMIKFYSYYDLQKDEYSVALQLVRDSINPLKEENICLLTNSNLNTINDNNTNVHYIDSGSNVKKVILSLSNATLRLKENISSSKITLNVKLAINHILPSLIQHISQKFYMYYMLPSITKLSTQSLWIILSSKNIYSRSEDEVLTAIINWIKNKPTPKEESLLSLLALIKWKEISIDSLIELITSNSKLLIALPLFEALIKEEFHRRLKEEYSHPESSNSFTNDLIDKVMNQSLKNVQCFQQLNPIKKTMNMNNNSTSVYNYHTTDNTTLISRNNISTNGYLYSHLEEMQSNSLIMKTNSSLNKHIHNSNDINQSRKKSKPRTFVKTDISLFNSNTESNESKKGYHTQDKSLSLESNVLTHNSCWVNTSISKKNETTQLKSQLDIIQKKINKAKQNKHIRHNTTNNHPNVAVKSPESKKPKLHRFTLSSQTFSK